MSDAARDTVDVEGVEYAAMAERWPLLTALMSDVEALRNKTWLPPKYGEREDAWELRKKDSFNSCSGYKDAIGQIVAKPFARDVTLPDDSPEWVKQRETDIDGEGTSLTTFLRELFKAGIDRGVSHILVDLDKPAEGTARSQQLPHFVHVKAQNLIGWRVEDDGTLSQIRIKETHVRADGRYADKTVQCVRVYTPEMWELWEQQGDADSVTWNKVAEGEVTIGKVPIVSFYATRTGFMTAEPPLEELAQLNLDWFRSYSEHRHALAHARFSMLKLLGFTEDEKNAIGKVGPATILHSTRGDATAEYAESRGYALAASKEHLDNLERKMQAMGLRPMVERSGDVTATETAINEARSDTDLQSWIGSEESAATAAFRLGAEWRGETLPDDWRVEISSDFIIKLGDPHVVTALLKMREGGELDRRTFLEEMRSRGFLDESVDISAIIEAVDKEPPPGLIGVDDGAEA